MGKHLLAMLLTMGLFLSMATPAKAFFDFNGPWLPTNEDVNGISLSLTFCTDVDLIKIYDFDEGTSDALTLFTAPVAPFSGVSVNFELNGNSWQAQEIINVGTPSEMLVGPILDLGATPLFGFLFVDVTGSGDIEITDYRVQSIQSNQHRVQLLAAEGGEVCAEILVVDATPVPVPGAVWLLGSGILGLVGLRQRFSA
jgi:hypothetical protein